MASLGDRSGRAPPLCALIDRQVRGDTKGQGKIRPIIGAAGMEHSE
ncbi:MAG: hypothetical protein ACREX9_17330 [Gammaproteobacteria bacterium]